MNEVDSDVKSHASDCEPPTRDPRLHLPGAANMRNNSASDGGWAFLDQPEGVPEAGYVNAVLLASPDLEVLQGGMLHCSQGNSCDTR